MRPTPVVGEPANAPSSAPPRSRKSSIVGDRRPSITSAQQTTSFFLAREEDVFGSSVKAASASRRSSASHKSDGKRPLDSSQMSLGSEGKMIQPDSMYGVQSLEDALGQAFGGEIDRVDEESGPKGLAGLLKRKRSRQPADTASVADDGSNKHSPPQHRDNAMLSTRLSRTNTISQPLTPLQLESPFAESAMPSTPKSGSFRSLRLSDEEEDAASQAITSGGEEEDEGEAVAGPSISLGGVAPELVMPSLSMPSRRPFTERGKQMGRLKIAVAGANGVGKTSLIRALVRQCEDIVHLDPITTPTPSLQTPQPGNKNKRSASVITHITEIQASTKAYPAWWSDIEDSRILRRRKSFSETVLERNLCFIDSSGFDASLNSLRLEQQPLIQYLEALFHRNAAISELGSSDLLGVLSGAGGVQIDVVLYICSPASSVTQHDFEYISKLSNYTTVIPIIPKADASPEAELAKRKAAVAQELPRCNVNPAVIVRRPSLDQPLGETAQTPMPQDLPSSAFLGQAQSQAPFLVSCLPGSDDGEMDASLLMSPSYSPPLVMSELQTLVASLFEPDTMAKLRHISARKFMQWRDKLGAETSLASPDSMALGPVGAAVAGLGIKDHLALVRNRAPTRTGSGGTLIPRAGTQSPFNLSSTSSASSNIAQGLPDYTRARIRDHVLREERLAQVQLAKWASDLQRSIRQEREEYARLTDGERARWLLERVGEETVRGTIGAGYGMEDKPSWALTRKERRRAEHGRAGDNLELPSWARGGGAVDMRDPLGLCLMVDGARRTGDVVLRVLGGGVLVGAVWVAICRAWGVDPERWWVWGLTW